MSGGYSDSESWRVYIVTFEDGFQYVGSTKFTLEDRLRRHLWKYSGGNAEIKRRIANEPYHAEVLHDNLSQGMAFNLEYAEIAKLKKPINIHGTNGKTPDFGNAPCEHTVKTSRGRKRRFRKRKVFPPRQGNYTCSKCRIKQPWTNFNRDRTRFNGLHSRCRKCDQKIKREHNKRVNHPVVPGKHECIECKQERPHTEFWRNRRLLNGLMSRCKDCTKA